MSILVDVGEGDEGGYFVVEEVMSYLVGLSRGLGIEWVVCMGS